MARRPIAAGPLTAAGAQRFREELEELLRRRAKLAARGDQDIETREELERIDRRARELRLILGSAAVITPSQHNDDIVRFGATVVVRNREGEDEYHIVAPAEADPLRGFISSASPLAKVLLNNRVGDEVLFTFPDGEDVLTILSVSYSNG